MKRKQKHEGSDSVNSVSQHGRIIAHHGVAVLVRLDDDTVSMVRVDRNSGHAAGDEVEVHGERLKRLPRRTELKRRAAGGRKDQIIAANVSHVLIQVVGEPPSRVGFIERAIVGARRSNVEPIIIVNKMDTDESTALFAQLNRDYQGAFRVIGTSVLNEVGIDELERILAHEKSLFAIIGPSGVGKSSLTNRLVKSARLDVQTLSGATGRGKHTTTTATLHEHPKGFALIDTPGIRDFAFVDVGAPDLAYYFPSFERYRDACKFGNCLHQDEPDCALRAAVQSSEVTGHAYERYLLLLAECGQSP